MPQPQPLPSIDFSHFADRFEFSKKDADKDGVISKNEMVAGAKSFQDVVQAAKTFARYDTDKDGNIDQKEYLKGKADDRKALEKIKDWAGSFSPFWKAAN